MLVIAQTCCILHDMLVEERKDQFIEDGIGGIRNGPLSGINNLRDDKVNIVPLQQGSPALSNGIFIGRHQECTKMEQASKPTCRSH